MLWVCLFSELLVKYVENYMINGEIPNTGSVFDGTNLECTDIENPIKNEPLYVDEGGYLLPPVRPGSVIVPVVVGGLSTIIGGGYFLASNPGVQSFANSVVREVFGRGW